MARLIIPAILVIFICIFGYKTYSRARTVGEVTIRVDRMIEDGESYNTISSGLSDEQKQRVQLIYDSIALINKENKELNELVLFQKNQIKLLQDSLSRLGSNYNKLVDAELQKVQQKFDIFKKDVLGEKLEEIEDLTEQNRQKDELILSLQQELILKNQQVDSLNQVIMEKNSNILMLTQRIQELQTYINKINTQLPETLKSIESIKDELVNIDKILGDSNVFNRKKKMLEAQRSIKKVIAMYDRLNQVYETQYFNDTIKALALLDQKLKP
jgi:chromosome segregation ATPase